MEEKRGAELQQETSSRIVGIKELVDAGLKEVPPLYVCPPHERPVSSLHLPQYRIPILDLSQDGDGAPSAQLIQGLGRACEEWGFFQVVNHGIEPAVIQRLRDAALKFFNQPAEKRMLLQNTNRNILSPVIYSSVLSFNPKVREWRENLSLYRCPGICDGFHDAPEVCKKEVQEYIARVEVLGQKLNRAIYESLGLDKEYIESEVPEIIPCTRMAMRYYPPCPDPSLTLGLSGHSDLVSLTVLHPDVVPGLEIKHKGMWLPISPVDPSAFVINLGDQIEILTNGKYQSIEHRVVTNKEKPRLSIACFFEPLLDTIVGPLCTLLDENHPPRYKPTKFKDYIENFTRNGSLVSRDALDFARI